MSVAMMKLACHLEEQNRITALTVEHFGERIDQFARTIQQSQVEANGRTTELLQLIAQNTIQINVQCLDLIIFDRNVLIIHV